MFFLLGELEEKEYFCIMNDLAIIIEYMLLSRNCVIVPGLGAFTTRTFASQWLEEEDTFLPPVRHIRFNTDVFQDHNDIFLHALEQIYNLDFEGAKKLCTEMVSNFHKSLVIDDTVDFGSIGLFSLEDDAEITMSPYECGVISPEYYGLDSFHFPLLKNLPEEESVVETCHSTEPLNHSDVEDVSSNKSDSALKSVSLPTRTYVADDKHIIIRLNRTFVHYTMVAAASVLLFFLLSPSVNNKYVSKQVNEATTNVLLNASSKTHLEKANESIVNEMEVAPEILENIIVAESHDIEDSSVELSVEVEQNNQLIQNELHGNYSIVLASAVSQRNAKAFVERLEKNDVHAIIYDNGKMLRVLIDGFVSQSDAYNVNNYLHKLDKELSSTWVMQN